MRSPTRHTCCFRDHTGDTPDWKILKLLPSAAVMSLGQRGIDAGYLNALVFCFFFFLIGTLK